jgi:hypothetical protein
MSDQRRSIVNPIDSAPGRDRCRLDDAPSLEEGIDKQANKDKAMDNVAWALFDKPNPAAVIRFIGRTPRAAPRARSARGALPR